MPQENVKYEQLEVEDGKGKVDDDEELKVNGGRFDKKFAFLQVTIRLPLDIHPLNFIALLYGFIPFIVPVLLIIEAIISREFIFVYPLLVSAILLLCNEFIFKELFKDPRPKQSANRFKDGSPKYGMPSGHVLNATWMLVWSALEVVVRGPGEDTTMHETVTWEWIGIILLTMGPVPWARVYNGDHTVMQCVVAGVLGTFVGIGCFFIRLHFFPHQWKPWEPTTYVPTTLAPEHAARHLMGALGI